jgi:hypothetical protein
LMDQSDGRLSSKPLKMSSTAPTSFLMGFSSSKLGREIRSVSSSIEAEYPLLNEFSIKSETSSLRFGRIGI